MFFSVNLSASDGCGFSVCKLNIHLFCIDIMVVSLSLCLHFSGIKSADPTELNLIASPPQSDFTSQIGNFKALSSLLPLVSRRVCTTSGGSYLSDGKSLMWSRHTAIKSKNMIIFVVLLNFSFRTLTLVKCFNWSY